MTQLAFKTLYNTDKKKLHECKKWVQNKNQYESFHCQPRFLVKAWFVWIDKLYLDEKVLCID